MNNGPFGKKGTPRQHRLPGSMSITYCVVLLFFYTYILKNVGHKINRRSMIDGHFLLFVDFILLFGVFNNGYCPRRVVINPFKPIKGVYPLSKVHLQMCNKIYKNVAQCVYLWVGNTPIRGISLTKYCKSLLILQREALSSELIL